MPAPAPFQPILGINFYTGDLDGLLALCAQGSFVVVPAAPSLVDLTDDPAYREAMERSDFAITDSGFMVLVWRTLTARRLERLSGLKLIRGLLASPALCKPGDSFWIMPSAREQEVNLAWLQANGYPVTTQDCYIAPLYPRGPLEDPALLAQVAARRPRYIIINLGGGVQERLGYFLRQRLDYRPAIICTGAAIAFITGLQADIPVWADAWMLGWLSRVLHAPRRFLPRYVKALRLVPLLLKYRERSVAS